jgi:hypothetical protein
MSTTTNTINKINLVNRDIIFLYPQYLREQIYGKDCLYINTIRPRQIHGLTMPVEKINIEDQYKSTVDNLFPNNYLKHWNLINFFNHLEPRFYAEKASKFRMPHLRYDLDVQEWNKKNKTLGGTGPNSPPCLVLEEVKMGDLENDFINKDVTPQKIEASKPISLSDELKNNSFNDILEQLYLKCKQTRPQQNYHLGSTSYQVKNDPEEYDIIKKSADIIHAFEVINGFSMRCDQLEFTSRLLHDIFNENETNFYQFIMAAGKTTVVIPLIILMTQILKINQNHGQKRKIVVVQPTSLVKQCINILISSALLVYPLSFKQITRSVVDGEEELADVNVVSESDVKYLIIFNNHKNNPLNDCIFLYDEVDHLCDNIKSEYNYVTDQRGIFEYGKRFAMLWDKLYEMKNLGIDYYLEGYTGDVNLLKKYLTKIQTKTLELVTKPEKQFRLSYGFRNESSKADVYIQESLFAVPYLGKDVPSLTSDYTDNDIKMAYTILSYKNYGQLRDTDMQRLLNDIYRRYRKFKGESMKLRNEAITEYNDLIKNAFKKISKDQLQLMTAGHLYSWESLKKIITTLDGSPDLILKDSVLIKKYLNLIFEKHLHDVHIVNNCSFIDVMSNRISKYKIGMTGTPYVHIPKEVSGEKSFKTIFAQSDANFKIRNTMLKSRDSQTNEIVIYINDSATDPSTIIDQREQYKNQIIQMKIAEKDKSTGKVLHNYHALVDTGAFFTKTSNEDIARLIFNVINPDLRLDQLQPINPDSRLDQLQPINVVYLNQYHDIMIYNGKKSEILKQNPTEAFNNYKYFVYIDQGHITGTNIKMYRKTIGLVTIKNSSRLRDVSQGIYRLRNLQQYNENGNKIKSGSDSEPNEQEIIFVKLESEKITDNTKTNLVKQMINNELEYFKTLRHYYLIQNIRSLIRSKKATTSDIYKMNINLEKVTLIEQIDDEFERLQSIIQDPKNPEIKELYLEYKKVKGDIKDVETEVENEQEQEQEQEKQEITDKIIQQPYQNRFNVASFSSYDLIHPNTLPRNFNVNPTITYCFYKLLDNIYITTPTDHFIFNNQVSDDDGMNRQLYFYVRSYTDKKNNTHTETYVSHLSEILSKQAVGAMNNMNDPNDLLGEITKTITNINQYDPEKHAIIYDKNKLRVEVYKGKDSPEAFEFRILKFFLNYNPTCTDIMEIRKIENERFYFKFLISLYSILIIRKNQHFYPYNLLLMSNKIVEQISNLTKGSPDYEFISKYTNYSFEHLFELLYAGTFDTTGEADKFYLKSKDLQEIAQGKRYFVPKTIAGPSASPEDETAFSIKEALEEKKEGKTSMSTSTSTSASESDQQFILPEIAQVKLKKSFISRIKGERLRLNIELGNVTDDLHELRNQLIDHFIKK